MTWGFRAGVECYHMFMITNELVEFIKAQRAAGKSDDIIRQTLLAGGGWEHEDVDEAIAIAGPSSMAIPRPPQPPVPPPQSTPPVQVMPSAPPVQSPAPAPAPAQAPAPQQTYAQNQAPVGNAHQWSAIGGMGGQFMPRSNPAPSQPQVPPQTQPTAQASSQPFILKQSAPRAQAAPKSSHRGALIFAIVILLIFVSGAYAYVTDSLPSLPFMPSKAPYSEADLLSGLLASVSKIDSAEYRLSMNLRTVVREKGAVPYAIDEKAQNLLKIKYQNDSTRIQEMQTILNSIRTLNGYTSYDKPPANPVYPLSIKELASSLKSKGTYYYDTPKESDPSGAPYRYERRADGKGFTLSIDLETQEAIDSLARYNRELERVAKDDPGYADQMTIEGRKVTFNEKTRSVYLYGLEEPYMAMLAGYARSVPENLDFTGAIAGTFSYPKGGKPTDWRSNFTLSGDFDDLSINVDVEARKVAEDYYFIANKFPSFFYFSMLSPIKGKWVKITSEEATTTGGYGYSMVGSLKSELRSAESEYKEKRELLAKDLRTMARIADEQRFFQNVGGPALEELDGVKAYRYDLRINKDTFVSTMERFAQEFKDDPYGYGLDAEELISLIKTDENSYTLDYMSKNVFFTLWADKEGKPVRGDVRFRVVPPDSVEHLADKQIDLTISVALANINNAPKVDAPKDFITAEEADDLLDNPLEEAREKGADASIKANLANTRAQAEIYYDMNKNSYAGLCTADDSKEGVSRMLMNLSAREGSKTTLQTKIGTAGSFDSITCHDSAKAYVIEAPLSASSAEYPIMYCIDSNGNAAQKTSVLAANQTVCRQ